MPVTYSIDPRTSVIHTRLTGAMDADDVRAHFDQLLADPACPPRLFVLMDAMKLGSIPTTAMIQLTRDLVARGSKRVRFEAVAVAASDPAHFGMFRMGQVLLESVFGPTQVFHDLASAREWLDKQRMVRKA